MKITIREAKEKDFNRIIELNKQLADFHRLIDRYYKQGSEIKEEKPENI